MSTATKAIMLALACLTIAYDRCAAQTSTQNIPGLGLVESKFGWSAGFNRANPCDVRSPYPPNVRIRTPFTVWVYSERTTTNATRGNWEVRVVDPQGRVSDVERGDIIFEEGSQEWCFQKEWYVFPPISGSAFEIFINGRRIAILTLWY